jgi:hypothetical protein
VCEGGDLSGKSHASVPYLSRMISRPNFVKVLEMLNVNLTPAEQANLFSAMVRVRERPCTAHSMTVHRC